MSSWRPWRLGGSMSEMPDAGEHHCEAVFVTGGDRLAVALRAAGLDDRRHAGRGSGVDVVPEREERVGSKNGTLDPLAGLPDRDLYRIDPAHLTCPHSYDLRVSGKHNRVALYMFAHQPRKPKGIALRLRRLPP